MAGSETSLKNSRKHGSHHKRWSEWKLRTTNAGPRVRPRPVQSTGEAKEPFKQVKFEICVTALDAGTQAHSLVNRPSSAEGNFSNLDA